MAAPAGLAGGDGLSSVSSISASSAVRSGFLARCWMADVSRESQLPARMKSPSFHWLNSAGAGWVNTATVAAGTVAGGTPDAARVDGGCDSFAAPFPGCSRRRPRHWRSQPDSPSGRAAGMVSSSGLPASLAAMGRRRRSVCLDEADAWQGGRHYGKCQKTPAGAGVPARHPTTTAAPAVARRDSESPLLFRQT